VDASVTRRTHPLHLQNHQKDTNQTNSDDFLAHMQKTIRLATMYARGCFCHILCSGSHSNRAVLLFGWGSGVNMTNENLNLKDEMEDPESDLSKSALDGGVGQDSEQFSVSIHL
jgi:hypothetical protein